ncbi:glycerol channel [Diaporthe australafricana]|uniref:Glycerol channel n=1 Tax=Diaporthe australafricana TaxID=127596 RepID=A0ABR3VZ74_9PEZI
MSTQTDTQIVEVKDDFVPSFDKAPDLRFTSLSSSGRMVEHREHLTPPETPVDFAQEPETIWFKVRRHLQEPFSEFFGTMVMILFGDGVVAQVVLSNNTRGDYQSITWGWGLAVMIGVYVGKKSGGHLNPAVTLSNCVFRGFPWRKFPAYFIAQLLGAMAGAFIVYFNYRLAIDNFEGGSGIRTVGGNTSSAGVFCTYPAPFMTRSGMFISEFVASSILMFNIFAFVDAGAGELLPLCLFFLIFGIGACFGWQTGYAINLARDFGPRLVSYILGYGSDVFSAGGYYFWVCVASVNLTSLSDILTINFAC